MSLFGNNPAQRSTSSSTLGNASSSRNPSPFASTAAQGSTLTMGPTSGFNFNSVGSTNPSPNPTGARSPFSTLGRAPAPPPTPAARPLFGDWSPLPPSEEIHSRAFMRSLARLFNDAKYSDATVHIHNITLPVHKSVICIQSAFFEKAFREEFLEGSSGVLELNESSGAAYWRVFEYLYTGNYSEQLSTNEIEDDAPLIKDTRVYALADMFFIENLKTLSHRKLQDKLKNGWKDDAFPDCIREVYACTHDSKSKLRFDVLEVAMMHAHELGPKEIFKDLLHEGGEFAVDYVDRLTMRLSMR